MEIDFDNIAEYGISEELPGSPFGSAEEFRKFPQEHKDQIIFLNREASKFVAAFIKNSGIEGYYLESPPFQENYFKHIESTREFIEDENLKKWLFNRGIPFNTKVFIESDGFENIVLTTWKMVVKYSPSIFFARDAIVLDKTLNWCLYFQHEGRFHFGKGNIYDPEVGYQKTLERTKMLNELKQRFPNSDIRI